MFKPLDIDKFMDILDEIFAKKEIRKKIENYKNNLMQNIDKNIDNLTSLFNFNALMNLLEQSDHFTTPVLILINIDSFRMYNQLYGFDIGNKILVEFANILKKFNKDKKYQLFRINADEFVLVDNAEFLVIDKYENDLNELFSLIEKTNFVANDVEVPLVIEITVGISFSSTDQLKKANMALYETRKKGKKFIGFNYDIDYTKEFELNLFWRKEIKEAIEENRVIPFYQPIVDRNKNIIKYESLIRIKKIDDYGNVKYIAPDEFLSLSKLTKQYVTLTKFMIKNSLKKMREENIAIAINLTYQDIKNSEINKTLKQNIEKYHLESQTEFDIDEGVILEILEHDGIDCYKTFTNFISEFKNMGVKIALDDFGKGFSNFSHIANLAPDFIKIDGTLIENIDKDKNAYELVKAIVSFAKTLHIKTIAEYVHSKEIFDITFQLGIDEFQGYYFGKPIETLLSNQ